jgi:hypothetical protein
VTADLLAALLGSVITVRAITAAGSVGPSSTKPILDPTLGLAVAGGLRAIHRLLSWYELPCAETRRRRHGGPMS